MDTTELHPTHLPASRICGDVTDERRRLLALVDVVVGYVAARHRVALAGWDVEAALVEARPGFRGGETVALRATAAAGRQLMDIPPIPVGALREMGSRMVAALDGIANVVPDVASCAPDVVGVATDAPAFTWDGERRRLA
jgi:GMP synthase PP-ATPase subunit